LLTGRQTEERTDKHQVKHNFLGGGNRICTQNPKTEHKYDNKIFTYMPQQHFTTFYSSLKIIINSTTTSVIETDSIPLPNIQTGTFKKRTPQS